MKRWIKLYVEILDDPKMGRMPDWLFRRAIELFLLAGRNGNDGVLPPVEDMAWILRLDETKLREALHGLAEVGVVHEAEPDVWMVTHFAERQDADTPAERAANYRKNVTKRYSSVTQPVTDSVTKRYGDIDKELEEEVDEDKEAEADLSGGGEKSDESYFSPAMKPLLEAFAASTGIHAPVGGGYQSRRWHEAMLELMRMRASPEEIRATCAEMLDQKLKIAGPWSILNGVSIYRARQRAPAGAKNGKKRDTEDVIREYMTENPRV